jgi:hypothetical protein
VLALQLNVAATFLALYLLPTKRNELREQTRLSPAW